MMTKPTSLRSMTSMEKKHVSFGSVCLHEFPPAVGDNPSVTIGVPVALAPKAEKFSELDLTSYELYRPPRRTSRELMMDRDDREKLLLANGFKQLEIADAIRKSRRARHEREHSYYNRNWDNFHEKMESTSRRFKKIVGLKRKDLLNIDDVLHYQNANTLRSQRRHQSRRTSN